MTLVGSMPKYQCINLMTARPSGATIPEEESSARPSNITLGGGSGTEGSGTRVRRCTCITRPYAPVYTVWRLYSLAQGRSSVTSDLVKKSCAYVWCCTCTLFCLSMGLCSETTPKRDNPPPAVINFSAREDDHIC